MAVAELHCAGLLSRARKAVCCLFPYCVITAHLPTPTVYICHYYVNLQFTEYHLLLDFFKEDRSNSNKTDQITDEALEKQGIMRV